MKNVLAASEEATEREARRQAVNGKVVRAGRRKCVFCNRTSSTKPCPNLAPCQKLGQNLKERGLGFGRANNETKELLRKMEKCCGSICTPLATSVCKPVAKFLAEHKGVVCACSIGAAAALTLLCKSA